MYYFLSILTGLILAVMVLVNGSLSDVYGAYLSNVIIHIAGLISILFVLLITRHKLKKPEEKLPFIYYSGGFIGVATVIFNNIGFAWLPVSVILALSLLGQCITSLLVDCGGWFHTEKQTLSPRKICGIGIITIGIVVMMVL